MCHLAFEINFQFFGALCGTCSACGLVLVFLFFILILGYRWRLFKDALNLRMDFVTVLMLLCTKSYVMSLNFINSLFLRLESPFAGLSWDLRTWNKWSNTCGFSGCCEQQLSWVSISLSPAKKRCEGWQPGFSWDQCWHDCLNNDYLNV